MTLICLVNTPYVTLAVYIRMGRCFKGIDRTKQSLSYSVVSPFCTDGIFSSDDSAMLGWFNPGFIIHFNHKRIISVDVVMIEGSDHLIFMGGGGDFLK